MYVRGNDRRGHAALYMRSRLENTFNHDGNLAHLVYNMERAALTNDAAGTGVEKFALVIDFNGFSLRKQLPMATSLVTLPILQNHYPSGSASRTSSTPPWALNAAYSAIYPFIDPVTRQKIQFVRGGDEAYRRAELSKHFDPAVLQSDAGGEALHASRRACTSRAGTARTTTRHRGGSRRRFLPKRPRRRVGYGAPAQVTPRAVWSLSGPLTALLPTPPTARPRSRRSPRKTAVRSRSTRSAGRGAARRRRAAPDGCCAGSFDAAPADAVAPGPSLDCCAGSLDAWPLDAVTPPPGRLLCRLLDVEPPGAVAPPLGWPPPLARRCPPTPGRHRVARRLLRRLARRRVAQARVAAIIVLLVHAAIGAGVPRARAPLVELRVHVRHLAGVEELHQLRVRVVTAVVVEHVGESLLVVERRAGATCRWSTSCRSAQSPGRGAGRATLSQTAGGSSRTAGP